MLRPSDVSRVQEATLLSHPFLVFAAAAAPPSPASTSDLRLEAQRLRESSLDRAKEVETRRQAANASVTALLDAINAQKEQLARLPDEIGAIEDGFADLCTELGGGGGAAGAQSTPLARLSEQHALLEQLEKVRDYLSVLARAEELRKEAVAAQRKGSNDEALQRLTTLAMHTASVVSMMSGTGTTKSVEFVNGQKAKAFTELAKMREERLAAALAAVDWPPPPPELQQVEGKGKAVSIEASLLASEELRTAWSELMKLQKKSEAAGVIPPCSARIDVVVDGENGGVRASPAAPGSIKYQPLLAVQCLLKPLLLRFYYHFDSSRSTNRLDKPEWYLSHILSLLRTYSGLFDPYTGAVALLCHNTRSSNGSELRYDLSAELLHGLIRPLTVKLESSIPLLLQNAQLLSHTIMQTVQFDQDVRAMLSPVVPTNAPIYLADSLLSNETVFEAWVQSERTFVSNRLNEELENPAAWLIGDDDGTDEGAADGSWAAMQQDGGASKDGYGNGAAGAIKTTRSAKALSSLIDGLTVRYRPLSSISHQLPFLLIQLSVLQAYAHRLERSLDAFESLSSAFARAIPGGIAGGGGGGVASGGHDGTDEEGDMVRGLQGLGRLIKTCLSALYMTVYLQDLSSQSSFLLMGAALANSSEGAKLLTDFRKWEGDEEERKLDQASLGELVRRGWRTGGRLASGMRPLTLAGTAGQGGVPSNEMATNAAEMQGKTVKAPVDVWEKARARFAQLAKRAQRAIEKLVVSEVLDGLRQYSQRSWDDGQNEPEEGADEEDGADVAVSEELTPSLMASLSVLASHLTHLLPSLPRVQSNEVYRAVSHALSSAIVERVVMAGGSHRFSQKGAQKFARDVRLGWIGVVSDVNARLQSGANTARASAMGSRPYATWAYLSDAASLLALSDDEGNDQTDAGEGRSRPTLQQACRAAFEPTLAGPSWEQVVEMLQIDDRLNLRLAREILRRRIECPW